MNAVSLKMILFVACGGALGAVGRLLVTDGVGRLLGYGFPYGTLAVNLIGSIALGALVGLAASAWSPAADVRAMLAVGFLGAFTTFSAFSMDAVQLFERGCWRAALIYIAASVLLALAGFWAGLAVFGRPAS